MATRSNLLVRTRWRAFIGSSILLTAFISSLVIAAVSYYQWNLASSKYSIYISSAAPKICEQIAKTCQAAATIAPSASTPRGSSWLVNIDPKESALWDGMFERIACKERLSKDQEVDCHIYNPGRFIDFYEESLLDDLSLKAATMAWLGVFVAFSLYRLYCSEANLGWRRVSLLTSFLVAIAGGAFSAALEHSFTESTMLVVAGSGLGFVVPLLGKRIFDWVKEGFRSTPPSL
jgi:hypothetical protein